MGSRSAAILVVALLIVPGLVSADASDRTLGIVVGDKVVFSYEIYVTVPSGTVGQNLTSDRWHNETITFTAVNLTAPLGYVGYTDKLDLLNGSTVVKSTVYTNITTIFDPYDNNSYLGILGFYPVAYTNLQSGNKHLQVTSVVNGTEGPPQNVTVSVIRTTASISVNFTVIPWAHATPMHSVMVFDSKTGVLERGDLYTNLFGVGKYFHYRLLSYTHPPEPGPPTTPYLALLALGVVIALVAVAIATRKPRSERKAAKMREKFRQ
ncbi:MAG: hypothetical protein ABSB29_00305 [Nitrososphaerales archaeon]